MHTVTDYIKENIGKAICTQRYDENGRIGLPHPYSVPTTGKHFHALFYWDTYFTNLAHIALGDIEQAKHNIEDFAVLIEHFGYIPNANASAMNNRSQPPFYSMMIRDVFETDQNTEWLRKVYPSLKKEYAFWINKRSFQSGLAHYGGNVPEERQESYARSFASRLGIDYSPARKQTLASNFFAQAESGWDFCPRFGFETADCAAVDLNSLIYSMENNLSYFASLLDNGEASYWRQRAEERAAAMRAFLKGKNGVFMDRNSKTGVFDTVFSAASFYPLFVSMATAEEAKAALGMIDKLMHPYGIAPCEEIAYGYRYQWAAPNGWACLQVIVADGLRNYGYTKEAEAIEDMYIALVEDVFRKTGALWEKYNLDTGYCDAVNEYEMPEMLGWTAGAYLHFLRNKSKQNL